MAHTKIWSIVLTQRTAKCIFHLIRNKLHLSHGLWRLATDTAVRSVVLIRGEVLLNRGASAGVGSEKKTFFGHALTVWNVAAQCCSISDQRGTPRRRRRSRRSPAIVADNPSHHLISTACSQIKTLRCMRCLIELKPCDETQQWGYEICKIVAATAGKYCFRSNKWTNDICICIHLVSFE